MASIKACQLFRIEQETPVFQSFSHSSAVGTRSPAFDLLTHPPRFRAIMIRLFYLISGHELEVKRGTAKIAVEGLVKRRAPQHFQQVWKDTTANLLLQGGAPRHLQFEEILSIDLKRLVVLVITRGSLSHLANRQNVSFQ